MVKNKLTINTHYNGEPEGFSLSYINVFIEKSVEAFLFVGFFSRLFFPLVSQQKTDRYVSLSLDIDILVSPNPRGLYALDNLE